MSLNLTPSGERLHIGFFGSRNAGKSSLVNAVTGQNLAIVSDVKGTTTDPVLKAMELLPLGPVVIIDTPGYDDEGELGELRIERTKDALSRSDIAVLVIDGGEGIKRSDIELLTLIRQRRLPYVLVLSKSDLLSKDMEEEFLLKMRSLCLDVSPGLEAGPVIAVSSDTGENIFELKELIGRYAPRGAEKKLLSDLVSRGDTAVLVCPIDESAPKGRLILPQQMAIRDLLDGGALPLVTRETELPEALESLAKKPAVVVTDSQAFRVVAAHVPDEIPLTSFSILMARYKGFLADAVEGVRAIMDLRDGDKVLLAEGCTHHRQCNDIGTVKIPRWLTQFSGKEIRIETSSGRGFPEDLTAFRAVIHCGGCMLTEHVVEERMRRARMQGVPFTNYGIVIAQMTGTLERSLRLFPDLHESLLS